MKPLDSWQLWYLSLCRCCTNYTCCACFLSLSLKKKKTLLHWQDFTLNSIQTLTQYSKKNIHNHIFLVAVCFHRKYLLLYSDIAQPHFDLNGAKGWWVLSAVIIMMLLCCECYFGQVSKAEMIILSSFVYVVKKNGKYLLKKKKAIKLYYIYKVQQAVICRKAMLKKFTWSFFLPFTLFPTETHEIISILWNTTAS